MLENPRVTKEKFPANESRLQGATVIGRCFVKGRIGSCIGLVLVDEDDNRFVAYVFNDRIVTIPEEPDGTGTQEETDEEEEADEEEEPEKQWQS